MAAARLTADTLIALFEAKATVPPPESSEILVRHLQCKESLAISRAVAEAMDRYAGNNSQLLAAPSELLPPLA
ncbi:MAG TPA: hypothetical protein VGR47_02915 [Terracidiphilus sp.]|nr:hypothetical protein [Terracidiphilus sp.]HEV2398544.1 hypothetical protein [Candidatus Sulfotelmatobacter sp.]